MSTEQKEENSRVQELATKMSAFRSILTEFLLVVLFAIGIFFAIKEILRKEVIIDLIEVPKELADKFSTNLAITRQLIDAATMFAHQHDKAMPENTAGDYPLARLPNLKETNNLQKTNNDRCKNGEKIDRNCSLQGTDTLHSSTAFNAFKIEPRLHLSGVDPDIQIPAVGPLKSIITLLKPNEIHISGEISKKDEKMRLVLRSTSVNALQPEPIEKSDKETEKLFNEGGEALLQLHSPCIAALSYFRQELKTLIFNKTIPLIEPCQNESKEYKYLAYLLSGLIEYSNNNFDKAIEQYNKAVEDNQNSADVYFYLGQAWQEKGRQLALQEKKDLANAKAAYKEAQDGYQNAREVDPNYVNAYGGLASLLADQDQPEEAIKVLQELQKIVKDNPQEADDIYLFWAKELLKLKFKEADQKKKSDQEAFDKFQLVIDRKNPKKAADAHVFWGNALLDSQKSEEAITQYQEAIKLQPDYASAYNNLGVALYSLDNYSEAIVQYQKAIDINANYVSAFNNWGAALNSLGKYPDAIVQYQKAIDSDKNYVSAYNNRGITFFKQGKYEEAKSAFEKADKLNPNSGTVASFIYWGNALMELALPKKVSFEKGDAYRKEAIEKYEKAAAINPNYYLPYYNQSIAYAILGESRKNRDSIPAYLNKSTELYDKYLKLRKIPAIDLAAYQSTNPLSEQTPLNDDYSLAVEQSESSKSIIPESLIWPLTGGVAVLLTGLLVIFLKRKFVIPDDISPPVITHPTEREEKKPTPQRLTQVEEYKPTPEHQQPATLLCVAGTMKNRKFPVEKENFSIGANSQNDLCIPGDEYVSGHHAYLKYEKGSLLLFDQSSRNGTFVNGQRIAGTGWALKQGDRIQIGQESFEVIFTDMNIVNL